LRMVPIVDSLSIHNVAEHIDAAGAFQPHSIQANAIPPMLRELAKVALALSPLRARELAAASAP